ncbi:DASH complex subunit dad3 [Yamadazyma tenuis]|uniref:DASH complex subunit DAD3 n=1 Tax=Candida tenuis (strain ATCC 10573 / BCRC 21748 / CBS 615 / JCM 9827 / NBRC 10315 / NRRL Y-1498 / VKM Y-70) TaxID=590646 RepID=G3B2G7_CANTC|nr:uncharacterized protein CANTEDRAFT_113462 [Yamadazyma tenuis ATCC 10573]EGV64671.1 hypothetical protein CANTEDRAFT_113462 [Yamadazyma tenuis ATCC 10573]WEJ97459.1 DASH complex subunit dad3 [Yamadazyma tenuis]
MSKQIYTVDFQQLGLPPLEAQVLGQYQSLASQLETLNLEIRKLTDAADTYKSSAEPSEPPSVTAEQLLDNLRHLEKKLGLVYTFFQGAVYQLFLQNEVEENDEEDQPHHHEDEQSLHDDGDDGDDGDDKDDDGGDGSDADASPDA